MSMLGNDGANLVEGRETLFEIWIPKQSRIVVETEYEDGPRGRARIRVCRELRATDVDGHRKPGA